jgi:hypothetical protein
MQQCHDCFEEFEGYPELAQHIVSQRKTHKRKSVIWAEIFLSKRDSVKEFKPRQPMSDGLKEIAKDCVRELSGRVQEVRTVCPDCHAASNRKLEVEFLQDDVWRNSLGSFVVLCENCRSNNYRKKSMEVRK